MDNTGKPKAHLEQIKAGINEVNQLQDRRAMVKELMKMELYRLKEHVYNPVTRQFPIDVGETDT